MERPPAPNERQRALLEQIATGEELGTWAPAEWRSVYALRDRGLLTVDKGGGATCAEVTEAGWFYHRHGHQSDDAEPADQGEPSGPAGSSTS